MKYMEIFIIALLIIIEKSTQTLSIYKSRASAIPISDCTAFVIKKYFTNKGKISIRYSANYQTIVANLLQKINFPVFINVEEIPQIRGINKRLPDEINIILDESTDKTKFLNRTLWNSNTQFIVHISSATDSIMMNIFQQFWAHDIANIIILASYENDIDINMYTFMPYNQYNYQVHEPILLAKWSSGEMRIGKKIIDRDRVKNLNGCTLNISVVNLPPHVIIPTEDSWKGTEYIYGTEATIFMEIANHLNFKAVYVEPPDCQPWGWILPEPYGVVGQVYQKKSQMGFGSIAISLERYEYLDLTISTNCVVECMSWAVPVGAKKAYATWIYLLITEFSFSVWCLMIVAFVFTVLAFLILSKNSNVDKYTFDENSKVILYAFRSSLGSFVKVPKSLHLKIVFMTWIWYTFVISSLYQSSLGSKLTVPLRSENINTFKDLLESDLEFTGSLGGFRLVIQGNQTDEVKAITDRFKETDYSLSEAIEKIINDRNIAYMKDSTTFMYNALKNPKAKGYIHYMKQCAHKFWAVIVLPKNSILTKKISSIIRKLFEAGLICKWRRRYLEDVPQLPPEVVQLTLGHLRGCFIVFCMGNVMAFLVFLAEHVYGMVNGCKSSRNMCCINA